MADTQVARRGGRARQKVKPYIEEQAEEQSTTAAPPEKRKRTAARASAIKKAANPQADDGAKASDLINEALDKDEDFKPPLKKAKESTRRAKDVGKVDSEGTMRLDTTEKRPPGEKKPAMVYEVPARVKGPKEKPFNLAAILAESFEDRFERKVSKIPRLTSGAPEKRLKKDVPGAIESYNKFLKRASTQRVYVLSRTQGVEQNCHARHDDCPIHQVKIAGTTGNVYTVIISHLPTCSCPNTSFKKNNFGEALCKHALYVLHYVLKAPEHLCYQNAFLTSEPKEITANAPALPTAVAAEEESYDGHHKPIEDDCPICCMEFSKGEKITWCRAACDNIHTECFNLWAQSRSSKDNVTCPYCRTKWEHDKPAMLGEQSATIVDVQMNQRAGGYFNVRDQLDYS